jgi:hypothetical protein
MPCLAHVESCGAETCPPPPRPCPPPPSLATDLVYLQFPRRMNLDSVYSQAAQCEPEPVAREQCMCLLFFIYHSVILSFGTPPKWFIYIVLIAFILGLINHTMV